MKRPIIVLAVTLVLMVVAMFFVFWQQTTSAIGTGEKLSKTREIVSMLDNTLSTLRDAESSAQGYVVTADPAYAKPYYRSRELLNKQLISLRQLATTDGLHEKLNELDGLMKSKVLDMDNTVYARTPQNFRDSWLIVVRGHGKQLMDRITALMESIKNTEEESATKSATSVAESNRSILTTLPIILIVYSLMVSLLVFFCFKFMHEKKLGERRLNYALKEIEQLNTNLNARVDDLESMTDELEKARDVALETNKLKSQFIANMSHEVRTPMSGVLGMSELLIESENLDAESRELVGYIHSSATNLLSVVNDLLDFSKLEAGKISLDSNPLSIEELVKDAIASVAPEASKKSLPINYSVSKDIPSSVQGDATRLRQILLNLLHNAVKFTSGGSVEVIAKSAARSADSLMILFEVRDTGIGITDEVQSKLFEPFVQADGSTTRRYGGTGLGLSICKSLVELMSGRIGVRSDVDKGSTFWFTVPIRMSHAKVGVRVNNEAA